MGNTDEERGGGGATAEIRKELRGALDVGSGNAVIKREWSEEVYDRNRMEEESLDSLRKREDVVIIDQMTQDDEKTMKKLQDIYPELFGDKRERKEYVNSTYRVETRGASRI